MLEPRAVQVGGLVSLHNTQKVGDGGSASCSEDVHQKSAWPAELASARRPKFCQVEAGGRVLPNGGVSDMKDIKGWIFWTTEVAARNHTPGRGITKRSECQSSVCQVRDRAKDLYRMLPLKTSLAPASMKA